jgi:imidazolonepropionase-like amidohydrolase
VHPPPGHIFPSAHKMLKDGAAYSQSGPQVAARLSTVRGAPATRAEIAFTSTYGFGDQREIELLVEAGFSAVEAIQLATQNGACYLGQEDQIVHARPGQACRCRAD